MVYPMWVGVLAIVVCCVNGRDIQFRIDTTKLVDGANELQLQTSSSLRPRVVAHKDDGKLENIVMNFSDVAHGIVPRMTVLMYPSHGNPGTDAFFSVKIPQDVENDIATLHIDRSLAEFSGVTMVDIAIPDSLVTSFVYELDSIPSSMVEDEALYDLRPGNASMNFKFLSRVSNNSLGLWVFRTPPIPDFVVTIDIGDERQGRFTASHVPPGGVGIEDAIVEIDETAPENITFTVHFFEQERGEVAVAHVADYAAFVDKFSKPKNIETLSTSIEFADFIVESTGSQFLSVKLTQPRPIKALMLSVHVGDVLVFREEERQVPFSERHNDRPFGWYHVIPLNDQTLSGELQIEAQFEFRAEQHPVELLKDWVRDHGGSVDAVGIADVEGLGSRHTLGQTGLVAAKELSHGDAVLALPYRLLLTNQIVNENEWVRVVAQNATQYRDVAQSQGVSNETIDFMLMTFFAIMQPNSAADGLNWRLYFDTLPKERPPLPTFYTTAEMSLFNFAPLVSNHSQKLVDLWSAELSSLRDDAPWIEEHVSRDSYLSLRSQLESRIYNVSGVLTLIPLIDYLHHDDNPAVGIRYDDEKQELVVEAVREVEKGERLTLDFGMRTKTKLDFLFQFGFIPPGAVDVAVVYFEEQGFLLTADMASIGSLEAAVSKSLDADPKSSAVKETISSVLRKTMATIPMEDDIVLGKHDRGVHSTVDTRVVEKPAAALAASFRRVLEFHMGADG